VAPACPDCRQAGSRQGAIRLLSVYTIMCILQVYALQSMKDCGLYIGISKDPNDRLLQHNAGMTRSTKNRRPFVLIYKERCNSRIDARNKEKYYKSGCGREFFKKYKK